MRILIVEDDTELAGLMAESARQAGHDAQIALNGAQGWDRLTASPPDILILDIQLPDMNGLELCRRLRQTPQLACTYVLACTGSADPEIIDASVQAGADDFLPKPFRLAKYRLRLSIAARQVERERTLRQSEARYRSIVEQQVDYISRFQPDTTLLYVNAAICLAVGRPEQELLGKRFIEMIPEADRAPVLDATRLAIATGTAQRSENRVVLADGTELWTEWVNSPVVSSDGSVRELQGVGRDITERKKMSEALKLFQRAMEATLNGVIIASSQPPHYPIVYVNPAFTRITGYSAQESIGRNCRFLNERDRNQPELGELRAALLEQRETVVVLRNFRKDGAEIWLQLNLSPVRSAQGSVTHFIGVQNDITERVHAQQELARQRERLRELAGELALAQEKERRAFASVLHDRICQELNYVYMQMRLLAADSMAEAGGAEPPSAETAHTELRGLCARVEKLIQETRSLTFELSPPVLYEIGLEAALEWLADDIAGRYGVACTAECSGGEGLAALSIDMRVIVFQCARELLYNAMKHAQARHVKVRFERGREWCELRVEDDGRGFDTTVIERRSTGFGLFSIRERLKAIGGELKIRSAPGAGTSIALRVPCTIAGK